MTNPPATRLITIGVDSHKDAHVAAAVDQLGRILATTSIPTTPQGFVQLERWASGLGQVDRFGIEGTGSFAAGLARWLQQRGYQVVEVTRPNRQLRRRRGKSDPVDAEAAARAVLAGEATAPKAADGAVEMLRVLRVARRSAVKAHTQAANQLASLVVTAPEPLPASSGRTVRHRLNRGGDRQANNALWRIVLVRMSCDARTRAYVARRTAEGKSKREIIRCLKRYIARELYQDLKRVLGEDNQPGVGQATQPDSSDSPRAPGRATDAVTPPRCRRSTAGSHAIPAGAPAIHDQGG
jgi:transposase